MTEIPPQDDKKSGTMSQIVLFSITADGAEAQAGNCKNLQSTGASLRMDFEGADQSPSELLRYPSPRVAQGF